MTINLQKLLDELEHFSAILENASELYVSSSELVRYCLPHGTLKELVEILWYAELQPDVRQKVRTVVHNITERISTTTASAIGAYAKEKCVNVSLKIKESWELYDKCGGEDLVIVLSNCFFLFYAIYDIRSIPCLFSPDEVDEFERTYYAAKQLLDQTALVGLKTKLSEPVLKMYGQKTRFNEEMRSVFAHKTFLFHISEDKINVQEDTGFAAALEKLIRKTMDHDFDISEMRELVKFNVSGKIDFVLFKRACSILPGIRELADSFVVGEFLKVLKCIVCNCNDWGKIMTYFYGEFREVNGSLMTFKQFYQNYDEDMKNLLIYLEDHAQLHTNQIKLGKAVDECAWCLLISPIETLISLFLQCLENVLMVPNLIRILRKLPEYCDIELVTAFNDDDSIKHKTPILMHALRHILTVERPSIQSDTKRRNFIYLCVALCRERHATLKDGFIKDVKSETEDVGDDCSESFTTIFGDIIDFALMDGSVILNYLVLPAIKQVLYQEIAIEIERKLLTSVGSRRTPIIWKAEQGVKLDGGKVAIKNSSGVSILQLISVLLSIINENTNFNDYALSGYCQDCLRLLGERLKEDGVVIEAGAFDGLLNCFDKSLWAYRYAVASWFYKCFASYKREVPLVLYEALKKENRQTFKTVKTNTGDSDVSSRNLLRKLFKLAVIHPELALDIVKDGFSTSVVIAGHDVSGALVDVIRDHSKLPNNKMDGLVEVIRVIVSQIDFSRRLVYSHADISESSFYGLRLIEPLLLIQEAVICAIHYDMKSADDLTAVPFNVLVTENQVAVKLLKLFCELAKDHIQKEMIDLRRSNIKRKVEIKEPRPILSGMTIDRKIRVETEMIQLYFAAIILANQIIGLPPYLKILLVQLINFHIELGGMNNTTLLDQNAKVKTISNRQPFGRLSAVADSNKDLVSSDCSTSQTFTISNNACKANRISGKSEQNAVFLAGIRMVKDRAMSTIMENRLLHNKRDNGSKFVVEQKPKHGASEPFSGVGNNTDNGNDDHFENGDSKTCIRNNSGDSYRINVGGFRRKNKGGK